MFVAINYEAYYDVIIIIICFLFTLIMSEKMSSVHSSAPYIVVLLFKALLFYFWTQCVIKNLSRHLVTVDRNYLKELY